MAKKEITAKKPAAKKAAPARKAVTKKTTEKKSTPKKVVDQKEPEHIGLVRNDSWLEPFEAAIRGRHDHAVWKISQLTKNGKKKLSDFAICISDCTSLPRAGCSVSGLRTLQTSI